MESLVLKNVDTGEIREVKADGLFFFVGMVPQTEMVRDMVECDHSGYIKVNEKMETNVPGLYAVGDCTQTFLRQVITSAADGAVAAVASERYVKELNQIQDILSPDSGNVAFLFYNPAALLMSGAVYGHGSHGAELIFKGIFVFMSFHDASPSLPANIRKIIRVCQ